MSSNCPVLSKADQCPYLKATESGQCPFLGSHGEEAVAKCPVLGKFKTECPYFIDLHSAGGNAISETDDSKKKAKKCPFACFRKK